MGGFLEGEGFGVGGEFEPGAAAFDEWAVVKGAGLGIGVEAFVAFDFLVGTAFEVDGANVGDRCGGVGGGVHWPERVILSLGLLVSIVVTALVVVGFSGARVAR